MSKDRLHEVVLPRRVKPQPTPDIVNGGDCGACVYGGLFDMPIERVYDEYREKRTSIDFWEMARMLRVAESQGLADRIIDQPIRPTSGHGFTGGFAAFGSPAFMASHEWHRVVQMAIDAGYYGVCEVDYDRKGIDGTGTNHWVLICGSRIGIKWTYKDHGGTLGVVGSGECIMDVLVSCSARATGGRDEWVNATEFLRYRGGFNMLFARPVAP